MYAGLVVEELPAHDLPSAAQHPYTRALLGAVPDIEHPRNLPLVSIPGQMPDASSVPSGCAFHTRCPLAMDECATSRPPLVPHAEGHRVACWAVERSALPPLEAGHLTADSDIAVGDRS
jgi:oligopeptide/dipeptide ABC transporter ATP-binding protein